MTSYGQQYSLSVNAAFRQQIAAAAVQTAVNVVESEGAVTDHANRLALAQHVIVDPDLWAGKMALAIVEANTSIGATAPSGPAADGDVFSAVAAVWNYFADALAAGVS